jgi:hypothetical protein
MILSHLVPIASRIWLSLAILIGLAVGRANAAWRDISDGGFPSDVGFGYTILAFGGVGSAFIVVCIFYPFRKQAMSHLLGMGRSHWLAGAPLAWLCGAGGRGAMEVFVIIICPNPPPAVDGGIACLLRIGHLWPAATEAEC